MLLTRGVWCTFAGLADGIHPIAGWTAAVKTTDRVMTLSAVTQSTVSYTLVDI